jgi:hypothetical protein
MAMPLHLQEDHALQEGIKKMVITNEVEVRKEHLTGILDEV